MTYRYLYHSIWSNEFAKLAFGWSFQHPVRLKCQNIQFDKNSFAPIPNYMPGRRVAHVDQYEFRRESQLTISNQVSTAGDGK